MSENEKSAGALSKKELAYAVAEKLGIKQETAVRVLQACLDGIVDALANGRKVEFRDFGILTVVKTKQRFGRNPSVPGETIMIPAHNAIKFKAGKIMKERVDPARK